MDVSLHLGCPFQKTPEVGALAPHEFPELHEADLCHLHAGVGFDTPQQIRTAPRGQAVALGGIPEKADFVAHAAIIITNSAKIHEGKLAGLRPPGPPRACPELVEGAAVPTLSNWRTSRMSHMPC